MSMRLRLCRCGVVVCEICTKEGIYLIGLLVKSLCLLNLPSISKSFLARSFNTEMLTRAPVCFHVNLSSSVTPARFSNFKLQLITASIVEKEVKTTFDLIHTVEFQSLFFFREFRKIDGVEFGLSKNGVTMHDRYISFVCS